MNLGMVVILHMALYMVMAAGVVHNCFRHLDLYPTTDRKQGARARYMRLCVCPTIVSTDCIFDYLDR